MPPAETDPIEHKSYTKLFFVLGGLFFALSVWAFYDEIVYRRSWKGYQREFNALDLKRVQEEYRKAKEAVDTENLRKIRLKIEEAEIAMEGKEFKKAQAKLEEMEIGLFDAEQRLGFAKADQDEVFYEWKHALEGGESHRKDAEKHKREYYDLEEKIGELKKRVLDAETAVAEVQRNVAAYYDELKKWKAEEKKVLEPLDKIEKKIAAIKSRGLDIKQVVIDDLGKGGPVVWGSVDRCESCHVAINRDGFENEKSPFKTHPFRAEIFGKHPIDQFGCTTCHGGQGRATQIKGKPMGEGDFVHGFVHHWDAPLMKADFLQASCNKCHQDQWKLDHAPVYMAGKKLFWDLGCTGCHAIKGFEEAPKVGPSLGRIASKVDEEWLINWIKNPREYNPHTRMPKVPLDIDEPGQVEKVASYILLKSEPFGFPFGKYPGGNAVEGKKTFETVGCYGCHALGDQGSRFAPALDEIAQKTSGDWIYNWIQDPKAFSSEAKMPDLRLTPSEAANVTAFLMQQGSPLPQSSELEQTLKNPENAEKGYLLVSQYGCYGCHTISGFEKASKLSVELTAFGKKEMFELDFGDSKVPRTWKDWTAGKLKDPRMYLTERTSSRMPNFGLTDEQIHALVLFLKGMKNEKVPERVLMTRIHPHQKEIDDGRRFVDRLNCKGCHMIEGEGREIEKIVGADRAPPNLMGIGARVRPEWMFGFLKNPSLVRLRPWIDVRMPTFHFSDDQTNTVIKYFAGLDKVPAHFSTVPQKASPEMVEIGAKLASAEFFSCYSCHIQGGKSPLSSPEQWGPDLALASERIRFEFIPEWVKDPQRFTPGVKMPAFLPSDDSAAPGILDGNRQKQAEALRDYLMSLGK